MGDDLGVLDAPNPLTEPSEVAGGTVAMAIVCWGVAVVTALVASRRGVRPSRAVWAAGSGVAALVLALACSGLGRARVVRSYAIDSTVRRTVGVLHPLWLGELLAAVLVMVGLHWTLRRRLTRRRRRTGPGGWNPLELAAATSAGLAVAVLAWVTVVWTAGIGLDLGEIAE